MKRVYFHLFDCFIFPIQMPYGIAPDQTLHSSLKTNLKRFIK